MAVAKGVFEGVALRTLQDNLSLNQKVSIVANDEAAHSAKQENPVMEIFGKISHEDAEEIRKNRIRFGQA